MAGPLSIGYDFPEAADKNNYVTNGRDTANLLALLDQFKNYLADLRGYGHNTLAAYQLYPAMYAIACTYTHTAGGPAPQGFGFPDEDLMDGLRDRGVIPVLWMQTNGNGHVQDNSSMAADGSNVYADYRNWVNGDFDGYIDTMRENIYDWSRSANSVGNNLRGLPKSSEVIIRLNQEVNGSTTDQPKGWFNYSLGYYQNSTYFIPFWRHVVNRYRGSLVPVGGHPANTVSFFLCTWNDSAGNNLKTFAQLYPGDAYVDYVGADIYANASPAPKMSAAFKVTYDNIRAVTSKPILIGETSTINPPSNVADYMSTNDNNPTGANGGMEWINQNWPQMRGIMWYGVAPELRNFPTGAAMTALAKVMDLTSVPLAARVHARGVSGSVGIGGFGKGRTTVGGDVDGFMGVGGALGVSKPTVNKTLAGSIGLHGSSTPTFTFSGAGSIGITGFGEVSLGSKADLYLWEGETFSDIEAIWEDNLP